MGVKEKIKAWIKLSRIFFYPLNFIAYFIGALAAIIVVDKFDMNLFIMGLFCIFFIELGVALTNDYFDYPSDKINKNIGQSSGGSKILVEGELSFKEVKNGIILTFILILITGTITSYFAKNISIIGLWLFISVGTILGWGYSAPPFRFSYRGWGIGEIVFSFVGGPLVIIFSYFLQTGNIISIYPWLLGTPLFLAGAGSIIIAEIIDYHADKTVSRKTLPVFIGIKKAMLTSIFVNTIAATLGILLWYFQYLPGPLGIAIFIVIPHLIILSFSTLKILNKPDFEKKMVKMIPLGFSYILWFALIPFISLLASILF
jgi:1,4-dihydroxy-2-naphthoate octaprenyltransferase